MLEEPLDSADGQGGVTRGFAALGGVWAQVTLLSSRETVAASADGADLRVKIVVRAPLALSLRHRFVDGSRVYRIAGYRDDGRFIEIDAELRVG